MTVRFPLLRRCIGTSSQGIVGWIEPVGSPLTFLAASRRLVYPWRQPYRRWAASTESCGERQLRRHEHRVNARLTSRNGLANGASSSRPAPYWCSSVSTPPADHRGLISYLRV